MRLSVTGFVPDADALCAGNDQDFVILLGGSGITRPRTDRDSLIRGFRELPFGILHVDGEYDDYDYLSDHPARPWNGGLAQTISRRIMRLCRGQVFEMGGMTVLTIGGGTTADRRDEDKYWDWWPEQDISPNDETTVFDNLAEYGNTVDIILTYGSPSSWGFVEPSVSSDVLERVSKTVDYGHWFFYGQGVDRELRDYDATAVTGQVIRLRVPNPFVFDTR